MNTELKNLHNSITVEEHIKFIRYKREFDGIKQCVIAVAVLVLLKILAAATIKITGVVHPEGYSILTIGILLYVAIRLSMELSKINKRADQEINNAIFGEADTEYQSNLAKANNDSVGHFEGLTKTKEIKPQEQI
ncbi:TPA: hypothetical protein ACJXXT_000200 [Pseudomonas aeruginosa]